VSSAYNIISGNVVSSCLLFCTSDRLSPSITDTDTFYRDSCSATHSLYSGDRHRFPVLELRLSLGARPLREMLARYALALCRDTYVAENVAIRVLWAMPHLPLPAHCLRTLKQQHPSSRCGSAIFPPSMVQLVPSSVRFVTSGDF
jgi:hypothetical protein